MLRMFKLLEDGAWHSLKEIAEEIEVPIEKLAHYCQNISKHQVIEYDADSSKVRLGHQLTSMIKKLKADEEAEAAWEKIGAGTVIVPPEKGFQIQGVTIQNTTEQDLKFEFTFNIKLKEIVISKA